ncbi:DNA-packaging protein [Aneurinibacillus thermoaerophilus]|nr:MULTISPECIES: DNA-packaging protein [Aneurinibacillus]MED0675795.1 DNA-packaging protein [Aneurinibacillus thermoaerophilus]MED0756910.1 DNA-packaging protein [Aneurinibacillus thermoaerophilus]MED0760960.1 DNA-packaging protein [Aneurinibacillus thermoaerophilus]
MPMAILTSEEFLGFYPECASWPETKVNGAVLRANVYVAGQVVVPEPVPDDLKLATAMIAKNGADAKTLKSTTQGTYSETYADVDFSEQILGILRKYGMKTPEEVAVKQKLWLI